MMWLYVVCRWWPPGTEKQEEAVGILSQGHIFTTAMMEVNQTLDSTLYQELHDNADILAGGNATMRGLMSCFIHCPPLYISAIREEFYKYLRILWC